MLFDLVLVVAQWSLVDSFCTSHNKNALSTDDRWLKAHNYFRCRHGHDDLTWKASQANLAQTFANKCIFQHSQSSERNDAGENLAMGYATPEAAVEAWYNEISDYVAGSGFAMNTGHYTALIWKSTTKLGCATCDSRNIHVCQYADATPNMRSQYVANIPQSNTPVRNQIECCARVYSSSTATTTTRNSSFAVAAGPAAQSHGCIGMLPAALIMSMAMQG